MEYFGDGSDLQGLDKWCGNATQWLIYERLKDIRRLKDMEGERNKEWLKGNHCEKTTNN